VLQFVFVQEVDDCAGRLATGLPLFPAGRGTTVAHSSHLILGGRTMLGALQGQILRAFLLTTERNRHVDYDYSEPQIYETQTIRTT
jgi:hypothetical protein